MTDEQKGLLRMADESLQAARLLAEQGLRRIAVSRAYYSMFYCAQAVLLTKGLSFSKHSGVIAAFGKEFSKSGLLPVELHRHLIDASELREDSDYNFAAEIDPPTCADQIANAETFINAVRQFFVKDK